MDTFEDYSEYFQSPTGSFGPHWDEEREMPTCMIGGNMCDNCYTAKRKAHAEKFEELVLDVLFKHKVKVKPEIVVFPENRDVVGVQSVYELTLTTTKDDPYELRQYLQKICESKMFDVKAFKACFELQENGHPHIHAMLWSGKKVLNSNHIKSRIKYPYRFSLKFVRRQENFYNYILKEKECPNIIEYCLRKGIQQLWSGTPQLEIAGPPIPEEHPLEKL